MLSVRLGPPGVKQPHGCFFQRKDVFFNFRIFFSDLNSHNSHQKLVWLMCTFFGYWEGSFQGQE